MILDVRAFTNDHGHIIRIEVLEQIECAPRFFAQPVWRGVDIQTIPQNSLQENSSTPAN